MELQEDLADHKTHLSKQIYAVDVMESYSIFSDALRSDHVLG